MKSEFDENGFMVVKENFCCEHYEPDDGALVPMRECWCCKWAKFDTDVHELSTETTGICKYAGNMEEVV